MSAVQRLPADALLPAGELKRTVAEGKTGDCIRPSPAFTTGICLPVPVLLGQHVMRSAGAKRTQNVPKITHVIRMLWN